MAYYAYKRVRDLLPEYVKDNIDGYNGDQWDAAADYIEELVELLYEARDEIIDYSSNPELTDKITKAIGK